MKTSLTRICALLMLIAISFGTIASAQYGRRGGYHHHHHYSGGYGAHHALHDVAMVADGAMTAYALSHAADYTGVRIGINAASMRTPDLHGLDHDFHAGLNIGLVFGWYLGNSPIIFEPGIFYNMKGGTIKGQGVMELSEGFDYWEEPSYNKTSITMHTFEIPMVFKYEVQFHNAGLCLQPFVGGFLSFGAGGRTKYYEEQYDGPHSVDGDMDTFSRESLGRTDAGLRYGCGIGIGQFYAEVSWDLGLVNLDDDFGYQNYFISSDRQHNRPYDDGIYSNNISFSVGFNF